MKSGPGTYALILYSGSRADAQIGRWGRLRIEPGYYIYVGSALGPGGVRARLSRHFRDTKTRHWHIDYLRELASPVCAWCRYLPRRLEHEWARAVAGMAGTAAVKGFGCSDCRCDAHLFTMAAKPDLAQFSRAVGGVVEPWPH